MIEENKMKAVIFDMDGTMIDSERIKEQGWKHAGDKLGYPIDDEILCGIRGTNRKFIKESFCEQFDDTFSFDELYKLRESYISNYILKNGIKIKEGLFEVLKFCKQRNYKLAIASSSKMRTIEEYLKKINVYDEFDVIISGDMVSNGKPHPEMYLKAIETLGIPKEQCIGIEDSINGVRSLCNAGIRAIMIPDLEKPPKELEEKLYAKLDSLLEVIDVLKCIEKEDKTIKT